MSLRALCVALLLALLSLAGSPSHAAACPGTRDPQLPCDAITAQATVRQADLLQTGVWLSLATATVAGVAAFFAWRAARAASKSYKAFVTAEDAFLFVEFPDGSLLESQTADGVRSETYVFTAKVTNLGRSPARLHKYVFGDEEIPILKTLSHGEAALDEWRLMVETLGPFDLRVHYSTALRPDAVLTVTAQASKVDRKIVGLIKGTKLRPKI